jgi:dihydrofolate synthase / folylpolyglutamate synthase
VDYAAAVAYLDEHASYDKTGRVTSPTLEPITRLVEAMGEPQLAAPVIHVTGTNGKGSTAQMITRLLMAQGLSVGTYTSPHLERVNERMARNAAPITDEEFAEQVAAIADLEGVTGVRPSYFEACTAAAFRWFSDTAVDVAVVEVGLLGRWDATNVVTAQVAVITNIGMDHNEFAGPTLVDIAREKAGIIKPVSAAVIGEVQAELVDVLSEPPAASRLRRGIDFETAGNQLAVGGRLVDLRTPTTIYPEVFVPLHGAHQGDNASIALAATEAFFAAPLSPDVVEEGFGGVVVPGRFEILGHQPLVIVDGAHNPPGADTCAQVFFDDFAPEGRRILVIGTLREPTAMLEALRADEFDVVVACTAPSPRGVPVEKVAAAAHALGCDEVVALETVREACAYAVRSADGDDAVLAAGSLYVAGEARRALIELQP